MRGWVFSARIGEDGVVRDPSRSSVCLLFLAWLVAACSVDREAPHADPPRTGVTEVSEAVAPPTVVDADRGADAAPDEVVEDLGPPAEVPVVEPETSSPDVPPVRYMGREIAQTMHYSGAEWLIRATREDEESASAMVDALGIERGQSVCDLGCGNGYHTLRLAERVGVTGRIFAVDVQPQMLTMLKRRADKAGFTNVERIVGTAVDPRLADESCDLILMVDVYHELSYPELMLASLRKALRPDGLVALVEFRAEDPDVPIKPLHKMSKEQIRREWEANGFRVVREFDDLPWQHLMFLGLAKDR